MLQVPVGVNKNLLQAWLNNGEMEKKKKEKKYYAFYHDESHATYLKVNANQTGQA